MRAADTDPRESRGVVAGAARGSDRSGGDGPFAVPSGDEGAREPRFQEGVGWNRELVRGVAGDVDRGERAGIYFARDCAVDVGGAGEIGGLRRAEGKNRRWNGC